MMRRHLPRAGADAFRACPRSDGPRPARRRHAGRARQQILTPLFGLSLLAGPAAAQDLDPALLDCAVRTHMALDQAQQDFARSQDPNLANLISILDPTAWGLTYLLSQQADCARPASDFTDALSSHQTGVEAEFDSRLAEGMTGQEAYDATFMDPVQMCGLEIGLDRIIAAHQSLRTDGFPCGWGP